MAYPTNNEKGKLTVQTAPSVLPVTVAELKIALRLDHTAHDTYLENLIKSARAYIETVARITLTQTTYDMRLDGFPLGNIELRRPPVSSVTSVQYVDVDGDTQTLTETTDYHVDIYSEPPSLEPNDTWPSTDRDAPNEVIIRYVAGYGDEATDIPEHIRQTIIAICCHMYENPAIMTEAVNGLHPNKMIDNMLHSFRRITIV